MNPILSTIIGVLTSLSLLTGLLGLLVKYALLPWLKEHLVVPVQETHETLTVNSHRSAEPTVLDRLDDLSRRVSAIEQRLN